MLAVSQEVYEEAKRQLKAEDEAKKKERLRIQFGVETMFWKARLKYLIPLANKYGLNCYGHYGAVTWKVYDMYEDATKLALAQLGYRQKRHTLTARHKKPTTGQKKS